MGKYKILVGDQTLIFGKRCIRELSPECYQVILTENNGLVLFQKIKEECPDLVVMDCNAPHMDAWAVICNAKEFLDFRGKYIVYGRRQNTLLKEKLEQCGGARYLIQPFSMAYLYQTIEEILRLEATPVVPALYYSDLEQKLEEQLSSFCVPMKLKGYRYILEGIAMGIEDPKKLDLVTKVLYRDLADLHHTTATSVERAVRIAIDAAWNSPGRIEFDRVFGPIEKRPSNQLFLKRLANRIGKDLVNTKYHLL